MHGTTLDLVYTVEAFWNTRGGISTRNSGERRGDLSLFIELDTEAAGWWRNGTFFLHFQEGSGRSITNRHVGDFQVLSNIDADSFNQVSQFWYRHALLDGRFWVKLGKMEANDDFAGVEYGGEFINSSAGFGPTIPLATFPDQDWGVVFGMQPIEWLSVNVGVYQGRPDGGRSIAAALANLYGPTVLFEPSLHYEITKLRGHLRVGGWWNGDYVDKLDGGDSETCGESYGWYFTWDQLLWHKNPELTYDEQGIGLFLQYGWGQKDRCEAEHYIGGGLAWIGVVPTRKDDILGLGIFHVGFSDEASFNEDKETALEAFYKARVFERVSITPDLQYIIDPGGSSNKDAVVLGARVEMEF
jgi:porin